MTATYCFYVYVYQYYLQSLVDFESRLHCFDIYDDDFINREIKISQHKDIIYLYLKSGRPHWKSLFSLTPFPPPVLYTPQLKIIQLQMLIIKIMIIGRMHLKYSYFEFRKGYNFHQSIRKKKDRRMRLHSFRESKKYI